ncbi:MaoC family dehydratase [Mycobacterium sp. C3-094]
MRLVDLYGQIVTGPFFDDLHVGQVFDSAPSMTLTSGVAAMHQAILGDRMRLPLDAGLSAAVTGAVAPLAHPALVCDVAIGQSTLVTQRVMANLFYRGLTFHRFPVIGDTLSTRTEVVGLKQNSAKPGRRATGLAALRVTTTDGDGRLVLDFHRCAMLPLSADTVSTGNRDDMDAIGAAAGSPADLVAHWDIDAFRSRVSGSGSTPAGGTVLRSSADVVSSAPELARLTLNIAATHHDSRVSGKRLVYGGHTIGLALAQATRLLPNLVVVEGWESCRHTAPVHEGDTLYSDLTIEASQPRADGNGVTVRLRSVVYAVTDDVDGDGADRAVLDWVFTALVG